MNKRLPPMIDDPSQPPYVRELLQAGRDFRVADYDVAKGLDKHLGHIASGTPTPPWAQSLTAAKGLGATGAASGTLVPWVVLPIATATVVAAVMLGTGSEPAPAPRAAVAATHAAPQSAAPAAPIEPQQVARAPEAQTVSRDVASPVPATEPREQPARPAPRADKARAGKRTTAAAKTATVSAEAPPLPLKTKTAQASGESGEGQAKGRAHGAQAEAAAAAPEATIAIEDPKPAAGERPAEPPAQPQPAPQDDARLEREMAMLAMSQRVLHSDPARALKLARQGESEFAGSMFTQERRQLVLLALVELGRMDEAKRLAKPYLARYPNGPFSDRVRRALATGKVAH
jgi:hypothetical protein